MLFSSVSFLFGFLPIVLILYYAIPKKYRNLWLLIVSLFFYFWGEPIYSLLMLASITSGYVHGLIIEKYRGTKRAKAAIVSSLVTSLGALAVFKYCDFFISSFNAVFGLSVPLLRIALPLGISFYTFQILSYTIDVYRGTSARRSFVAFGAYISMFPQLVAGPIVRYSDIEWQLDNREYTMSGFALGVRRFIAGLSKKIIFANSLAELTASVGALENPDTLACWLGALGFTLQIYFDFSGYSDMARGLGGMLGFEFPENFRYPYLSGSVSEFWRRWHMTLGTWFRDYVYIPLGGSR
ncbi:MAG: MBOAT family protein, partial [Ruminococcaceae bacterium]|nr:MBOAT family protein [Oscillospiraceae bacterium]